jgi:hypothetical protein
MRNKKLTITSYVEVTDPETGELYDEEIEEEIPSVYEVCDRCGGEGTHTNPAIDGNGITASEWAEWDYEDRENYMNGVYDVTCEECNGANVILCPDYDMMTEEQIKKYEDNLKAERQYNYEDAYIRRMESGGY